MRLRRAELFRPDAQADVGMLAEQVGDISHVTAGPGDLDPLFDQIGEASFVLLGEASHGTSDFYTWRAQITQRLIREKNFSFVAVEGDWPDCYQVNRYIKGYPDSGGDAYDVLREFERWPTWMWSNWEIAALTEWMRQHNEGEMPEEQVGFYGLDVYSLWDSMKAIMDYLQRVDPEALKAAKRAFGCFEPYGEDVQDYAIATRFIPESCEDEVVDLLKTIRSRVHEYPGDRESKFNAEQNALVAVDAERYYRSMVRGGSSSWNIRDSHMADTLDRLMKLHGPDAKAIVWEHNTHVGDARATDMVEIGEVNVGQIVRERHLNDGVVLVGFGTHHGTVVAGNEWGEPMQVMPVPPAAEGSWEDVFFQAGHENRLLISADTPDTDEFLRPRGHRAIGVVYNPAYERFGNYVPTVLPERYDAFIYLRETQALHPLTRTAGVEREAPETYPWGV